MTYASEKIKAGRRPCTIVEIDQDVCSLTYGCGACTAAIGTTGSRKCYNTRETCQDPVNFTKTSQTLRFSNRRIKQPTVEDQATEYIFAPAFNEIVHSTDDGVTWTALNESFTSLTGVAHDKSRNYLMACGYGGELKLSCDLGVSWESLTAPTSQAILSIEFADSLWVITTGGTSDTAYWSDDDGTTWTETTNTFPGEVRSVRYLNGIWFLSGDNQRIETSTDGKTYTLRYNDASGQVRDTFYVDSTYFAVGNGDRIYRSTNGTSWSRVNNTTSLSFLSFVCKFGSTFYAYGASNSYFTSSDGITWSGPTAGVFTASQDIIDGVVLSDGSVLLYGDDGDVVTTSDGATFSEVEASTNTGIAAMTQLNLTTDTLSAWEGFHSFPVLRDVDIAPTEIKSAKDIGARGAVTVRLQDFIYEDSGIDKYAAERTHDRRQGTFFSKLYRRQPFLVGRTMRVKRGFLDDDGWYKAANFSSRTYIIESIKGPSTADGWAIEGKDILKLADDERAKAPAASTGSLSADISSGATSLAVGSGEGTQYGTSGKVRIGDEIIAFSGRSSDTLTGLSRGQNNTTAESHSSGDRVQLCLEYTSQSADAIIADLLTTYAGIASSFLDTAAWSTALETWFPSNAYTAIISEPTSVRKLLNELAQSAMILLWWDERDALVKLDTLRPPRLESALTLLNDSNIIENSVGVSEDPKTRLTQSWVFYDQQDPTKNLDEDANYLRASISINSDAELAEQYGDTRVSRINSRWLVSGQLDQALAISSRTVAGFARPRLRCTFSLDAKDNDVWTGDLIRLQLRQVVDSVGSAETFVARIISAEEGAEGDTVTYLAERSGFRGRYAFIGPNALNDYADESNDNRSLYGFICTDPTPTQMSDNSEPYKIV